MVELLQLINFTVTFDQTRWYQSLFMFKFLICQLPVDRSIPLKPEVARFWNFFGLLTSLLSTLQMVEFFIWSKKSILQKSYGETCIGIHCSFNQTWQDRCCHSREDISKCTHLVLLDPTGWPPRLTKLSILQLL